MSRVYRARPEHVDLAVPMQPQSLPSIMSSYPSSWAIAGGGGFFAIGGVTATQPLRTNAYGYLISNGLRIQGATGKVRPVFIIHAGKASIAFGRPPDDAQVAVEAGPLLIQDGKATVITDEIVKGELTGMQPTVKRARAGIGIDADGNVVYAAMRSATLAELQTVLLDAGCRDAMALDGGGSVGVVEQGKGLIIGASSRALPAAIVLRQTLSGGQAPERGDPVITKDFIPTTNGNRPGRKITPTTVTIHSTANPGATAKNHASYVKGPQAVARKVSWHYTVDDQEAYQHLPEDEEAWHAGTTEGNRTSIGVEICEFTNSVRQAKAIDNAIKLVAMILRRRGWGADRIKAHRDWTGKDCPRILQGATWRGFIDAVKEQLGGDVMLRQGSSGAEVRRLQEALNRHGAGLAVDGAFGPATDRAVREFQRARGLAVDGIVGPATWAALEHPAAVDWQARALKAEAELDRIVRGIRELVG